jgi:hypothetical protein
MTCSSSAVVLPASELTLVDRDREVGVSNRVILSEEEFRKSATYFFPRPFLSCPLALLSRDLVSVCAHAHTLALRLQAHQLGTSLLHLEASRRFHKIFRPRSFYQREIL